MKTSFGPSSLASRLFAILFGSILAVVTFAPASSRAAASKADNAYIDEVANGETNAAGVASKKSKNGWWARSWSSTDGRGFYGKPVSATGTGRASSTSTENSDPRILIRYTRYATEYDAEFHSPVWGAYTIDQTALANDLAGERPASNPDFARPGQFFQDPMVVTFCTKLDFAAASHGTFTSTYDPRFPQLKAGGAVSADDAKKANSDRAIQRGHMVPNNAMKCQGTIEQGQTAQIESFSVANIVPQMAKSNAPSWSALESACFDWAQEIGQVWLIVGPVYHDRDNATFIRKLKGDAEQPTPSPDELFYVVIGKRNGKPSAVGFLMPHDPNTTDFHTHAVAIDEIESKTGLNFMPDLGEPNAMEQGYDAAWLQTKPRKKTPDDD